jgi:hypothetical protein
VARQVAPSGRWGEGAAAGRLRPREAVEVGGFYGFGVTGVRGLNGRAPLPADLEGWSATAVVRRWWRGVGGEVGRRWCHRSGCGGPPRAGPVEGVMPTQVRKGGEGGREREVGGTGGGGSPPTASGGGGQRWRGGAESMRSRRREKQPEEEDDSRSAVP